MLSRDRPEMAARAMRSFRDQTYPRLELVVVSQGTAAYRQLLARLGREQGAGNVRVVGAGPGLTLGALRNLAVDAAAGELVCQWDDDDGHHPERVARQVQTLVEEGARACYLTEHLHLVAPSRRVYWIDWTLNEARPDEYRVFPPTVLMVRDPALRYPEEGSRAMHGEDLSLAAQLFRGGRVATVRASGWLYLYVFHGANQMPKAHHERLTQRRSAGAEVLRRHAAAIGEALRSFGLDHPLEVCGPEGVAFGVR